MSHEEPPLTVATAQTYSERIHVFPTCQWDGFAMPYPPIPRGDIRRKAIWAMRAASERWEVALARRSTVGLDKIDFGVAVFAKAMEV